MDLYLVCCPLTEDENGIARDCDQVVAAESPEQALKLWLEFALAWTECESFAEIADMMAEPDAQLNMYHLPAEMPAAPGVIEWRSPSLPPVGLEAISKLLATLPDEGEDEDEDEEEEA